MNIDRETLQIAPFLELAATRPHWLGPREQATPENGILRRSWHGYRFDIGTGESADGRGYRLAVAPGVAVDPVNGAARLVPRGRPRSGNSTVNKPSSGRKAQI